MCDCLYYICDGGRQTVESHFMLCFGFFSCQVSTTIFRHAAAETIGVDLSQRHCPPVSNIFEHTQNDTLHRNKQQRTWNDDNTLYILLPYICMNQHNDSRYICIYLTSARSSIIHHPNYSFSKCIVRVHYAYFHAAMTEI